MRTLTLQTPRMVGIDVSAWQHFLTAQKLFSDAVDGVYGPSVAQGTRGYQTAKGLSADGIVGGGTFFQAVLDGFESPAGRVAVAGMDTDTDCLSFASCIAAAGMKFVVRYYSNSGNKNLSRAEAMALSKAGLQVAAVYEDFNNDTRYFSAKLGGQNAAKALRLASGIGQPAGSAIYFAADFNPELTGVRGPVSEYFTAVAQAFAVAPTRYAVGVYGSGLTCRIIRDTGLATFTWLSCSTGFQESAKFRPQAHMLQIVSGRKLCKDKLVMDGDIAQSDNFGAFRITS